MTEKLKVFLLEDCYSNDILDDLKGINTLKVKCHHGHVTEVKYASVKSKKVKCSRCVALKPYYEIKHLLESEGFEIVNNPEEFQGSSKSKMSFRCKHGHIMTSKCSHIRMGHRCKYCRYEEMSKERRLSKYEVLNKIESINYKLIDFVGEYKSCKSRIIVQCDNKHEYETSVESIFSNRICRECYVLNNRGSSHHSWRGGRRVLYHQLRNVVEEWRINCLKDSNYTCFVTGDKKGGNLVVHHSINFSDIIDNTLSELNLPLLECIGDYSDEELFRIERLCLEKHYKIVHGVVMTDEVHRLFHKIYSYHNNTMEQVLEFKQDYLNGKFDDVLPA